MGIFFNAFRMHFETIFRKVDDLANENRTIPPSDYSIRLKSYLIEAVNYQNQARE